MVKVRDSGMPDERLWEALFDVALILERMGIDASLADLAELGCGYGTFSIPVAKRILGDAPHLRRGRAHGRAHERAGCS